MTLALQRIARREADLRMLGLSSRAALAMAAHADAPTCIVQIAPVNVIGLETHGVGFATDATNVLNAKAAQAAMTDRETAAIGFALVHHCTSA